MAALSTPYFIGLTVILALVVTSVAVDDPSTRLILWAAGAASAIVVPLIGAVWRHEGLTEGFRVSESMAERFALFTIIVLGEVIVGVVDGLTEAGGDWTTRGVGWLCLGIGFGIWWNYFDFVGRRPPRPGLGVRGLWLVSHLPLSMSVAATGAGMVSLIEHAWIEAFIRHARLGDPFVADDALA
jgi:low temperature requirement protein LtrA